MYGISTNPIIPFILNDQYRAIPSFNSEPYSNNVSELYDFRQSRHIISAERDEYEYSSEDDIPKQKNIKIEHPFQLYLSEHEKELSEIAKQQNIGQSWKKILALQQFAKLSPQEKEKYFQKVPIKKDSVPDDNSNKKTYSSPIPTFGSKVNQNPNNVFAGITANNNSKYNTTFFTRLQKPLNSDNQQQRSPQNHSPIKSINPLSKTTIGSDEKEKSTENPIKETGKDIKPVQTANQEKETEKPKEKQQPKDEVSKGREEIKPKLLEEKEIQEIQEVSEEIKKPLAVSNKNEEIKTNEIEEKEKQKIKKEKKHKHKSKHHHHHKSKNLYGYNHYQDTAFYFSPFQQPYYYQTQPNVIVAVRKHPSSSSSSSSDSY